MWLERRVKSVDLSDRTKKDYLSAVDLYLITAADDIEKPLDFRDMGGDKQTRGIKDFLWSSYVLPTDFIIYMPVYFLTGIGGGKTFSTFYEHNSSVNADDRMRVLIIVL
jgi:hypothetical protein